MTISTPYEKLPKFYLKKLLIIFITEIRLKTKSVGILFPDKIIITLFNMVNTPKIIHIYYHSLSKSILISTLNFNNTTENYFDKKRFNNTTENYFAKKWVVITVMS